MDNGNVLCAPELPLVGRGVTAMLRMMRIQKRRQIHDRGRGWRSTCGRRGRGGGWLGLF